MYIVWNIPGKLYPGKLAMFVSTFFLIFLSFNCICFALNFGFSTSEGDTIVVGEISSTISSKQIKNILRELNSYHSSYCSEFNETAICCSITRLVKCNRTGIDSFNFLFEIELIHWISYFRINLKKMKTLSSFLIIFHNPLLITTRKTISNYSKVNFVEPIIFNLFDEIWHGTEDIEDEFDDSVAEDPSKSNHKINFNFCAIL